MVSCGLVEPIDFLSSISVLLNSTNSHFLVRLLPDDINDPNPCQKRSASIPPQGERRSCPAASAPVPPAQSRADTGRPEASSGTVSESENPAENPAAHPWTGPVVGSHSLSSCRCGRCNASHYFPSPARPRQGDGDPGLSRIALSILQFGISPSADQVEFDRFFAAAVRKTSKLELARRPP